MDKNPNSSRFPGCGGSHDAEPLNPPARSLHPVGPEHTVSMYLLESGLRSLGKMRTMKFMALSASALLLVFSYLEGQILRRKVLQRTETAITEESFPSNTRNHLYELLIRYKGCRPRRTISARLGRHRYESEYEYSDRHASPDRNAQGPPHN